VRNSPGCTAKPLESDDTLALTFGKRLAAHVLLNPSNPGRRPATTQSRPVRVVCVTSGKGGVGKTNVTVNLALALSLQNQSVMLLDADLGLGQRRCHPGLHPFTTFPMSSDQERTPGRSHRHRPERHSHHSGQFRHQAHGGADPEENAGLVGAFSELNDSLDVMLIDSAAGISDSVVTFSRAAHEVMVVVCDEPASITDAYALIKLLSQDYGMDRFQILANRVATAQEGRELFTSWSRFPIGFWMSP
jgi:flagellar biosynthesis protein FlhG